MLGWREVPIDPDGADIGETALGCMPHMSQIVLARRTTALGRAESNWTGGCTPCESAPRPAPTSVYFPSLSSRTMAYKGMLTTMQLPRFFPDLRDERCSSAIAIVHSRFSTNTFPSWPLAHPFRFVAHNGEINTVRGNRNRMHAREAMLASARIPGDLSRLSPICTAGGIGFGVLRRGSRAAASRRSQPAARRPDDDPRGVGEQHLDGPAASGVLAVPRLADGAVGRPGLCHLHRRHGGRGGVGPQRITAGRWWRTIDDRIILASESGVLDVPSAEIVAKGRLEPGKMFLIDTAAGRIVSDDEIKAELAQRRARTASGCTPVCSI